MVMPSSGPLNMGGTTIPVSVAAEIGLGLTTTISMDQANVRALAGVGGSGTSWSMSSLYGKSWRVAISSTFAASTANASLNVAAIGGYVAGRSDITITVNAGVYLYSTSTGTPGLTLSGGTSGDTITLVNNGFIMGMGGSGGVGPGSTVGNPGGIGLQLGYPITVNNTNPVAYIGGGGGGGGSGANQGGGGGAGGAAGGNGSSSAGGGGGGIGGSGSPGATTPQGGSLAVGGRGGGSGGGGGSSYTARTTEWAGGGGGGRIFPGVGGAGGTPGNPLGQGGSANAGGGAGGPGIRGAGGGGWGASGGTTPQRAGGSGGRAVFLNGQTVTWVSGNTTRVYGAVS